MSRTDEQVRKEAIEKVSDYLGFYPSTVTRDVHEEDVYAISSLHFATECIRKDEKIAELREALKELWQEFQGQHVISRWPDMQERLEAALSATEPEGKAVTGV